MLAKRQLQQLAHAITASPEYAAMAAQRKIIKSDSELFLKLCCFEREHERLLGQNLPVHEAVACMEKLHADNNEFLNHEEVKLYHKLVQDYKKMIDENLNYLDLLLVISKH